LTSVGYQFTDRKTAHHSDVNIPPTTYKPHPKKEIDIQPVSIEPVSLQPTKQTLLITSYLLKTKVNKPFFKNLLKYASIINAQVVVLVHRYHNPTNDAEAKVQDGVAWIDPIVEPYLCWKRFEHGDFTVYADVRINPTALNPLNSLRSTWRGHSIYGHTTQSLTSGNNSVNHKSPIAWCTGTVSLMESADNLTAKKAEYHQRFGFLVCDGQTARNVHARRLDGSFSDLNVTVKDGVLSESSPSDMIWGDLHIGNHDSKALDWAIGWACQLKPSRIVMHDVFDGSSINPHAHQLIERQSVFANLEDEIKGNHKLLDEIGSRLAAGMCSAYLSIASSNHHDFLDRYFRDIKPSQISNAERKIMAQWLDGGYAAMFSELQHLDYDFESQGVRLGNHGHKGSNGARGSLLNDFNSGLRQIAGHTHVPGVLGGAERVGCLCKLVQGYNSDSLSGWVHSIAIVQPNGKIQHLIKF